MGYTVFFFILFGKFDDLVLGGGKVCGYADSPILALHDIEISGDLPAAVGDCTYVPVCG